MSAVVTPSAECLGGVELRTAVAMQGGITLGN